MSSPIRFLSPAETAAKLGVSVKALRLYETRGLVKPVRTAAGWRAYGPEQVARLHQVLALKRLGLPLARVGELLAGRLAGLDAVLAVQEQALALRREETERALSALRAARGRLARGETLSVDDLATLTQETTMTDQPNAEDMRAIFDPLAAKHLTPDQLATAEQRKQEMMAKSQFDQEAISRQWAEVFADAERVRAKGDPSSPEAFDVVRRWKALQEGFTQGDPSLSQNVAAMWKQALADPDAAPKLPMSREIWDFVAEASAKWREAGSPAG